MVKVNQQTNFCIEEISELLLRYRMGKDRKIIPSSVASGTLFDEYLQKKLQSRLSIPEQDFIKLISNQSFRGLVFARRGFLDESVAYMNMTARQLQEASVNDETLLLCRSFFETAAAYVDCKCERWDRSAKRLLLALKIDKILEQECEYSVLHLHRIQLVHNFIRLYSRYRQEDAINLANAVVEYLTGNRQTLPIIGQWNSSKLVSQYPEFIHAWLCEIIGEVGLLLAGQKLKNAKTLFNQFQSWRLLVCEYESERLYQWCQIKHYFLDSNIDNFIDLSSQFLVEGRDATSLTILWYITVLDIMRFLEATHIETFCLFRDEVLKDIEEWEHCPRQIKRIFKEYCKTV